jgi:phage shock protein C
MPEPRKQLRRSRTDRTIAGVIGGIAQYLDIDPTLARVGYVVLSVLSVGFPGILVYILLWIIVPEESQPL